MARFTPPPAVQEYLWKIVTTGIFILGTVLAGKYIGPNAPALPSPPTITVQPVVVGAGPDGVMRVLNLESTKK